jgi:hypothetical protein
LTLYDRIGDLNAFALVQRHFERLQDVTSATMAPSSRPSATPSWRPS